jgi:hypothetical protein
MPLQQIGIVDTGGMDVDHNIVRGRDRGCEGRPGEHFRRAWGFECNRVHLAHANASSFRTASIPRQGGRGHLSRATGHSGAPFSIA